MGNMGHIGFFGSPILGLSRGPSSNVISRIFMGKSLDTSKMHGPPNIPVPVVGKMRADCHRTGVKGTVDTRENSTVKPVPSCTWADVVKGTTQAKAIRGQEMLKCNVSNKSVLRPLPRNNPVSKVKV